MLFGDGRPGQGSIGNAIAGQDPAALRLEAALDKVAMNPNMVPLGS